MNNISRLTDILFDAISDFASNASTKTPAEWLQDYLQEKLPDKAANAVKTISAEIMETLGLIEQKKLAMNKAIENGQSAENWFVDEVMNDSDGNGSKAQMATELLNGISIAEDSLEEVLEGEIIDIDSVNWSDEEWNDFKLKDTLINIAIDAGKAGLREIVADAFVKAADEGLPSLFEDSEFVKEELTKGALLGLKVAVSAGLTIAAECGVIPPTTAQVAASIANNTIESLKVFFDVANGEKTMTEAVIAVKNTAISTLKAMWQQHKEGLINDLTDTVGTVFGVKAAVITGTVIGLLTPPQEGNRIMNAIKGAAKATVSLLTKEIHLPSFNKIKTALTNPI